MVRSEVKYHLMYINVRALHYNLPLKCLQYHWMQSKWFCGTGNYTWKSHLNLERHGVIVTLLGSMRAVNCLGFQLPSGLLYVPALLEMHSRDYVGFGVTGYDRTKFMIISWKYILSVEGRASSVSYNVQRGSRAGGGAGAGTAWVPILILPCQCHQIKWSNSYPSGYL